MFKFGLPFAVGSKCMAGMGLPLGLKREHFAGTNIAGHEICLLEWDIKLRFISELDRKHLVFTDSLQPPKSSDAVLEMHNKVTFCQFTEIDLRAMAFYAS